MTPLPQEPQTPEAPAIPAVPAVTVSAPTATKPAAIPAVTKTPAEPQEPATLVLDIEDVPFTETMSRNFGEVPDAEWPAKRPGGAKRNRLLPDLFADPDSRDTVNVEGELLFDDSQEISRMVDGVGMKIHIDTH